MVMIGHIPTTQVTITGSVNNVITGAGWTATMWSNYVDVTLSPATQILSFNLTPVWDSDTVDASTGVNQISMTYPTTSSPGYINSTTVHVSVGSSSHLVGISFWALVI
jgi:hypothetical protein